MPVLSSAGPELRGRRIAGARGGLSRAEGVLPTAVPAIGTVHATAAVDPPADASPRPWSLRAIAVNRRPIGVCADG